MIAHHFSIQISKHFFMDANGIVQRQNQALRATDAIACGLQPIIIYTVTVEGLRLRRVRLSPYTSPTSVLDFLTDCWGSTYGLNHRPHVLRIQRTLLPHLHDLQAYCGALGVKLDVMEKTSKSYAANKNAIHGDVDGGYYLFGPQRDKPGNEKSWRLDGLQNCVDRYLTWEFRINRTKPEREAEEAFALAEKLQPMEPPTQSTSRSAEFVPGEWIFGDQKSIPPQLDCPDPDAEGDEDDWAYDQTDENGGTFDGNDLVKNLLAGWPETPAALSKRIGITARELDWYLLGKRGLTVDTRTNLFEAMGIKEAPDLVFDDGSPYYKAYGDYVMFCPEKSTRQVSDIFSDVTGGGDQDFSFEILPKSGPADPSFRYMLTSYWGVSIIVFARGSRTAAELDKYEGNKSAFINFSGPIRVDDKDYRSVVLLCAKCKQDPGNMATMMENWKESHESLLEQLESAYERFQY